MKKFLIACLTTTLLLSFSFDASAQYRGKKKKKKKSDDTKSEYFDESNTGLSNLWYGLDIDLDRIGFGPQNLGLSYTGNIVKLGFIGTVGYKITENISAGPKFGVFYTGGRFNDGSSVDVRLDAWDFSLGGFGRINFLRYCFAHVEIETLSDSFLTGVINSDNSLEVVREYNLHYYIGPGIGTSGRRFSFAGYLLYDFSLPNNFGNTFNIQDIPLQLRIGVRYRY